MTVPKIKLFPPKRRKRKVIIVLPVDQIQLLDDAANAIGIDRSAFLTVYIDTFAETIQSFVAGWLTGMKFYQEKVAEEKNVRDTSKMLTKLTGRRLTTSRRRGRPAHG